MSFNQNKEQSVPQRSGVRNEGQKYELQVITLLAAKLAKNSCVDDYWIIASPENVSCFDDIIAILKYTTGKRDVIMLQVKHSEKRMKLITHAPKTGLNTKKKINKRTGEKIKYVEIPLHKYLIAYNSIKQNNLNNKTLLDNLKDIPFQNYFFGIFTTMGKEIEIETKKETFTTVELELSSKSPLSFLSTNGRISKMPLISTPPIYKKLLSKLYFFTEQANSSNIHQELQTNIPSFTNHMIDNLCNTIEKSMNQRINGKMECFPLTKKMFFESSLQLSLSQTLTLSIDNGKDLKPMMDDTFKIWQSIFEEHNVTIIHGVNINKIMKSLYSFYQQQIRNEYNLRNNFSWESCVENCFQLNQPTIEKTHNSEFTSTNLSDLLIYMWKKNKIPLIVDNKTSYWFKTAINRLSGCGRQYILLVNKEEEIQTIINQDIPDNMTIFRSMVDIKKKPYFEDIMGLKVSLQGRNLVPLKDVIDGSENILEAITPCDILEWTYNRHIKLGKVLKEKDELYIDRQFSAFNQVMDEKGFIQTLKPGLTAISNEPGMGKSTVITSLALLCEPTNYVLASNLADCVNDLESNVSKIHSNPIQYFFEKNEGSSNNLLQKILQYHESTKRLILLLDSFDEIAPVFSEKVLNILQKLSNITHVVTTRTQGVSELKNRFKKINVVQLKNLNQNDIAIYCNKWGISEESYNNMPTDFLTVPLHLSMFAYRCANFEVDTTNMLLSNFYAQFIYEKIDIYFTKINIIDGNNKFRMTEKKIIHDHMKVALVYSFGIDSMVKLQIINIQIWNEILEQFKNYKMSLGILSSIENINGVDRICFVHKTYAEYFVAKWLSKHSSSVAKQTIYDIVANNEQHIEIMSFLSEINVSRVQNLFKNMKNHITKIKLSLTTPDHYNMILVQWASMNVYYHADNDSQKILKVYILERVLLCSVIVIENSVQLKQLSEYFKNNCSYWKNAVNTIPQCDRQHIDELVEFIKNSDFHQELNLEHTQWYDDYLSILLKFEVNHYILHIACLFENSVIIGFLLDSMKTDVNAQTDCGDTPLHICSFYGNQGAVEMLLNYKANPTIVNKKGQTCLHIACIKGNLNIARLLLQANADPTIQDENGRNCVDACSPALDSNALNRLLDTASITKNLTVINFFLNYIVKPNVEGKAGLTNIQRARQYGNSNIFFILLLNDFPFLSDTNHKNCLNARKFTEYENNLDLLLYDLFLIKDMKFVKFLLQHIEPNVSDASKCNVLHTACLKENVELVSELLNYDANPRQKNNNSENCLHAAVRGNNIDIFNLVLEKGVDPKLKNKRGSTCLHLACENGNVEIVQKLIKLKLDFNILDVNGENCLHVACRRTNVDVVKLLLKHSSEANLKQQNKKGSTYLHLACQFGSTEIVQTLIALKLDPNILDLDEEDCLHAACRGNNVDIVKLLLNHSFKTDLKRKNKYGCTYLDLARISGSTEIVQTLKRS